MRLVAFETSTRRGSVALVAEGRVVARATHELPSAHAEQLRPLLDLVLAQVGWARSSLERVAVGMGPGSFTGLRVGIAFAQGVALGLGVPWVGVASLRAMAHAVPREEPGARCPLLDARREEVFAGAFDAAGVELLAPRALPRASALEALAALLPGRRTLVGEVLSELEAGPRPIWELAELPDAGHLGLIAEALPLAESIDAPLYVRDAGATPQKLPPSPLTQ